ncbi:MAG: thiamine phosphate synthase [Alphaproteobacteria bacterium]
MAAEARACRLYLVTPPAFEPSGFGDLLAAALDAGDVAAVQLRLKGASDDAVLGAAGALRPLCHAHDVAFLVNDRPDLAVRCEADGVHIGQEDASYEEARRLVGPDRIVGVTCHDSRHFAMVAAEAGADYVAFGAFFPSGTKAPKNRASPDILAWWSELALVPCVAIGGITVENCAPLIESGADFLAVVGGVWEFPDGPAAAVRAFNEAIGKALAREKARTRRPAQAEGN